MLVHITRNYYDKQLKRSVNAGENFVVDETRAAQLIGAEVAEETVESPPPEGGAEDSKNIKQGKPQAPGKKKG